MRQIEPPVCPEVWNLWRKEEARTSPDLSGADLSGARLSGADLSGARLSGADLSGAILWRADLSRANLFEATLRFADLGLANLSGAGLTGADLASAFLPSVDFTGANLRGAALDFAQFCSTDLSDADLSGARLLGACFSRASTNSREIAISFGPSAELRGTNLSGAVAGNMVLGGLDISSARIGGVDHSAASTVGVDTLRLTAAGLASNPGNQGAVEAFFRGCGVPDDMLDLFRSWIGRPIQFYSVFISYSHADKPFARRLYDALQAHGVRCWLDEKNLRIGDLFEERINDAIRLHDKLILCCSKDSLRSDWVEHEMENALEREEDTGKLALLPLDLDGRLFDKPRSVDERKLCKKIRKRLVGEFRDWKQHDSFEEQLERLLVALKPDTPVPV